MGADDRRTKQQLLTELRDLRSRIAELEGGGAGDARAPGADPDASGSAPGPDTGLSPGDIGQSLLDSETRFRALVEAAADAFFLHDVDGRIVDVNRQACESLGYSREELLRLSVADFDRHVEPEKIRRNSADLQRGSTLCLESQHTRKDGHVFPVEIRATTVRLGGRKLILSQARDITAQRRAEEQLRQANEEWEQTFNAVPDLVAIIDCDHRIVRANRPMTERFADSGGTLCGRPCYEVVHGMDRPPDSCPHLALLRDGREHTAEVRVEQVGRTYFASASPLRDAKGQLWGSVHVARDITRSKRAAAELQASREQLRSLTARLAQTQEDERRALARELHDRIGQTLVALDIDLHIARDTGPLTDTGRWRDRIDACIGGVRQVADRLDDIMAELRPAVLDDLGLSDALAWLGQRHEERTRTRTEVDTDRLSRRLADGTETAVFRIAQEALTNVTKHASATRVTIRLREFSKSLRLTIKDNGAGFDPERTDGRRGYGMLNMRERALAMGGECRIKSVPGRGTTVTVEVGKSQDEQSDA